jgi:tRNA (guanosine-2'-O-)-methyltransferase
MRRTSPGVLTRGDPSHARLDLDVDAETERAIVALEPLVTDARRSRLLEVIGRRLSCITVVLDRPYDPHNGAAILRSCEAFGVHRLHVVERRGTPFAIARSVARGAEKWIDVVRHQSAAALVASARSTSLPLVAAHPEGALVPQDLERMPRFALVLGNEREGIHDDLAAACEARVRVPMRGFIESLNVSVTAAILLDAATRGRAGDLDERTTRRLYARGLYLTVPRAAEILSRPL